MRLIYISLPLNGIETCRVSQLHFLFVSFLPSFLSFIPSFPTVDTFQDTHPPPVFLLLRVFLVLCYNILCHNKLSLIQCGMPCEAFPDAVNHSKFIGPFSVGVLSLAAPTAPIEVVFTEHSTIPRLE